MLRKTVALSLLFTLLTNGLVAQAKESINDSTCKDKKFLIGLDFPKVFTSGGMQLNKVYIAKSELTARYFVYKRIFGSLAVGYGQKKDIKAINGEQRTAGGYVRLGLGADIGPNSTSRIVFGYNICYASYKSKIDVTIKDDFWDETYSATLNDQNNRVLFHELYSGFRLNFMKKQRVGFFVEQDLRFRFGSYASHDLNDQQFVPGYGKYNEIVPSYLAFNIITGITF